MRIARAVEEHPPEEQAESTQSLLIQYARAKAAVDQAESYLNNVKDKLVASMETSQTKSIKALDGGTVLSVTYTRNTRHVIDEKGLRKALTAKVFDKFTDRKLNRDKLTQAMAEGAVDATVVAKYTTEQGSAPFLRFTSKEAIE